MLMFSLDSRTLKNRMCSLIMEDTTKIRVIQVELELVKENGCSLILEMQRIGRRLTLDLSLSLIDTQDWV